MEHNDSERRDKARRDELELAEFERDLRHAMQRRTAPIGLKQRVLAQSRERRRTAHGRLWMLQRVAASAVLAAVFGGFAAYHQFEERAKEQRRGEEAREQVLTAMRITNKTLSRVSTRLADKDE